MPENGNFLLITSERDEHGWVVCSCGFRGLWGMVQNHVCIDAQARQERQVMKAREKMFRGGKAKV